jgi:predicted GNAT family acetyltransferase
VQVERVDDATEFLARTERLRAEDPVLTNVIGTVALSAVAGRQYPEQYWWLVSEGAADGGAADGAVVGCAMRTPPWNLAVSPMPAAAAAALGAAVAPIDPDVPGVSGPREVVDEVVRAFVSALEPVDIEPRVHMTDVVHVLGEYVPPPPVPGSARRATADEVELLVEWLEQFTVDAGLVRHDPRASVQARVEDPGFWWWEFEGVPVAMAAHAPLVQTPAGVVGRIGPVYTPAQWRRRGFGAAVTATVLERLLPQCSTVMLYADADNPTSNGVYARLGFRPVAEVVEVAFRPESG